MPPPCTPPHWKPDKPAIWMHWKLGSSLEASIPSIPGRDSFGCHLDGDRCDNRTPSFDHLLTLYRDGTHLLIWISIPGRDSFGTHLDAIWNFGWRSSDRTPSFDSGASPGFKINSERELSKSKIIALRPIWMHWKPKIILYTGTGLIWMHTGEHGIQNNSKSGLLRMQARIQQQLRMPPPCTGRARDSK